MASAMDASSSTTVWELLREPDYRRMLGSQYVGQAADGIAQAVLATELVLDPLAQGTPGKILGVFALTLLPYSLLSPFLGVFVDRWDRRRVLIGTNFFRFLLLATLPLWSLPLPDEIALMLGILGLLGLGRLFHTTKAAVLPVVLHEHHLVRGNTVSSVGGTLSVLAGAGFGLWLGRASPAKPALVGTGVAYLIAAWIAARIQANLAHSHENGEGIVASIRRIARELVEGVREVRARRSAAIALGSVFAFRTITVMVAIGVILLIKTEFTGQASSDAFALGAAGVGAFLGAVSAPRLGDRFSKPQLIISGFVIAGAGIIVLGGITALPAVLALMGVLGLGGFISKVAADAQIQEVLPDIYRGRAFSLYDILYNLASVIAGLVAVMTESMTIRTLFVISGVSAVVVAVALIPTLRSKSPTNAR
jgi:MFS family permease